MWPANRFTRALVRYNSMSALSTQIQDRKHHGHRDRLGEKHATTSSGDRIAIVGGGILGMTLAKRLAEGGKQVTLIEAAPHLGGLADAWEFGGITWDRHYHVTLLSDLHLRKIIDQLGLADEMEWVETKTGFYTDGQWYSMSNTLEFLKFPPLNLIQKLRLVFTIFLA
ncbi:MAG: FAD-dependent oxidoreductase [Verrucomicrobiota bacterium]